MPERLKYFKCLKKETIDICNMLILVRPSSLQKVPMVTDGIKVKERIFKLLNSLQKSFKELFSNGVQTLTKV